VRAVIASDTLTGTEGRDADKGGRLAGAGGRDATAFGGGLDDRGRHIGGFDGVPGGDEGRAGCDGVPGGDEARTGCDGVLCGDEGRTGFGGALASAEDRSGSGGALANPPVVQRAGFAGTTDNGAAEGDADFGALDNAEGDDGDVLENSEERDAPRFGAALSVGAVAVTAGMSPLVATFTGMLWDSGTSSQPLSISSSAGFARFSVSCEVPSAPFAMSFKVPEPLAAWQVRTAHLYVVTPARFSEP
jgi:hypothetical protein